MKRSLTFLAFFFFSILVRAQEDVVEKVAAQLADSRTKFPGMRPQIFFSQDKYAPGDTAFFRLFVLTEDERILAERSLLTLELVTGKGAVVLRQNVSSVTFGAANQIILPDNLVPGHYEIRIYSHDMTVAYGLTSWLLIVGEKAMEPVASKERSIGIFPEGGHVVLGSINRMIVRATGMLGGECFLRTSKEKVTSITLDEAGYGSVQFVPQAGETYWVETHVDGKTYAEKVPESKPGDISLRVYPGPRRGWILDVLSSSAPSERIFLVLIAQREVLAAQEVYINATGKTQIVAAADYFPEGYSELFLVDANHQIRAYRPIYEKARNPRVIQFSGVPETAGQRQEVKATLRITDGMGVVMKGAVAISVIPGSTRLNPMQTPDPSVVLHGNPPAVSINQSKDRIEMELLTQPVPQWIVPIYPKLTHRSSLSLSGRVQYRDSTSSLPLLSRLVIYFHNDLIRYDTEIDGRGYFTFPKIYDFFGNDLVYFKAVHLDKDLDPVRIDWTIDSTRMPVSPRFVPYVPVDRPEEYGALRKQKGPIERSYGFFLNQKTEAKEMSNPNQVLEDEFQEADITIYPKDYTPFDTMQELILEVIPSLEFRKRSRDSTVHVTLLSHSIFVAQRYANGNPLYVIDGLMTSDTRYFMSLSPREIVSFKIINEIGKLDKLGLLARNGVVFVQTETPERTRRDLAGSLHVLEGISPTLFSTAKPPAQKRVPDLRSLLYWNPLVQTDSTGVVNFNYHTSDIPGTYFIRVMGTTDTGHMVSGEYKFSVKLGK